MHILDSAAIYLLHFSSSCANFTSELCGRYGRMRALWADACGCIAKTYYSKCSLRPPRNKVCRAWAAEVRQRHAFSTGRAAKVPEHRAFAPEPEIPNGPLDQESAKNYNGSILDCTFLDPSNWGSPPRLQNVLYCRSFLPALSLILASWTCTTLGSFC